MFMWANDLVMSTPFTDSSSPQVCPPTQMYPKPYTGTEGLDCSFPEALAHIEEKCHGQVRLNIYLSRKKNQTQTFRPHAQELCSMTVAPEAFGGGRRVAGTSRYFVDPCQGYRKYVEVAYKCKPTEFKSKVACHSDSLNLTCSDDGAESDAR